MNTRKEIILISVFGIKLCLDFLLPYRDLNFVIIFLVCAIVAGFNLKAVSKISQGELRWICLFFGIISVAYLRSGDFRQFLKLGSLIFIYASTRAILLNMTIASASKSAETILRLFYILFIANYFLSLTLASPSERIFFNFEHANLLGSYILLALTFIYSSKKLRVRYASKISLLTAALLSTSTGAALLASISLLNPRKINLKSVILLSLVVFISTAALYFALNSFFPDFFRKIFAPFILIYEGKLAELGALASQGVRIQELGDKYQGSLVWRFYAYYVFVDFIGSQSLISLFLGNGFFGYRKVWGEVMPHNDFILVFIDFGLVGLLALLFGIAKFAKYIARNKIILLPLFVILVLRLLLENNIYSFYLMSSLTMNSMLLFHSMKSGNDQIRRPGVQSSYSNEYVSRTTERH